MSAVPADIEITYKVPKRRHPVLAFVLQQPLGTAGLVVIADDPGGSVRAVGGAVRSADGGLRQHTGAVARSSARHR